MLSVFEEGAGKSCFMSAGGHVSRLGWGGTQWSPSSSIFIPPSSCVVKLQNKTRTDVQKLRDRSFISVQDPVAVVSAVGILGTKAGSEHQHLPTLNSPFNMATPSGAADWSSGMARNGLERS